MAFWQHEEHEVAYSWLRAPKLRPQSGNLATREARDCLQLAPGPNVASELRSGNTRSTKLFTVGSVHPKFGRRVAMWQHEGHEVTYS